MKVGILIFILAVALLQAQTPGPRQQTMRPVVRGTHFAVTSMKPESSMAAEQVLRAGGNAFDAIVAGQAVLALADYALNGIGSDAVLLVYDSREKKVFSVNAEGTAPRLATIDWYKKNQGGRSRSTTACSPARCRESSTRGTSFWTGGEPRLSPNCCSPRSSWPRTAFHCRTGSRAHSARRSSANTPRA